ncbi:pyridoxamine 5'-phosphate oxidase family protein [Halorientalis salina]|uniref:pyridoxamine 5'-phosphate oxidase family protein n=1 Tax=Halorientalis salina TaxID=2932266 RepID=UPI00145C6FFB
MPTDDPVPVAGPWDRSELSAFLDDAVVPIRLSCRTPSDGLWMLSLWYRYEDGRFWCATGADADIVRFLREDPRVAFEVSVNEPPYRGVRGQGTVAIDPDPEKTLLRALLDRYLDGTDSQLASRLLDADREEVTIRIDPTKVSTWDYRDRMPKPGE